MNSALQHFLNIKWLERNEQDVIMNKVYKSEQVSVQVTVQVDYAQRTKQYRTLKSDIKNLKSQQQSLNTNICTVTSVL